MSLPFSFRGVLLACSLATLVVLPGPAMARSEFEAEGEALAHFAPLPARISAGDEVELRWSELPGETEELELLLSLDDGRTFHVRVSPELEGDTRHYRWLVPNLPAERARLRLRIGDRERESEGATSPAFEILGAKGAAPELDQVHEGSWWSGFGCASARVPSEFAPAAPRATLAAGEGDALAPPPRPPAAIESGNQRVSWTATGVPARAARSCDSPAARRFQPLRN